MKRRRVRIPVGSWMTTVLLGLCSCLGAFGQRSGPAAGIAPPGAIPLVNVGSNTMDSQFERLDFAQMVLRDQNVNGNNKKDLERRKQLIESGTLSELDLSAPAKAVNEYNRATSLMGTQHSQEAITHLQKAVATYPNFVFAHIGLGLAYLDLEDPERAQIEFETAARLDEKFAPSFVNLGRLQMSQNNFTAAESNLGKAAALRPNDAGILTALAYAQHGNRQYGEAIQTVGRVHDLPHKGMGNAHYVAAVAAVNLSDYQVAQREFTLFLEEDPSNPLAPTARSNLDILRRNQQMASQKTSAGSQQPAILIASAQPTNLANSDRLKAQLDAVGNEPGGVTCDGCSEVSLETEAAPAMASIAAPDIPPGPPVQWTIRTVVDEVAVFFGVTSGGRSISDLDLSDIKVRDDNKAPEKVLQFASQSKLPLRLGLLIDTSGSVQDRFSFEKHAAAKFLQQMLTNASDLGFVAGFSDAPSVGQDFTADHAKLAAGVNQLTNQGGTALFDAVSFGCWKLAAYPERERVAKVLVVVSDGEDNASHISLRQTIRDVEATGVTVYTISTREDPGVKTDADKVLQTLAERSGGEAMFPGDLMTLGKSFDKLRDQIRSRYLIAYRPADFEPNGKYRTISITAEKGGKRLQVHARKGYHARIEAVTP